MKSHDQLSPWIERLVQCLCGDYWAEGITGDLLQNFKDRTTHLGKGRAKIWLYLELLVLLRFIFYKKEGKTHKNSNIMFREYFKIGFRVLVRNKVYSFINLFGLGAGMACALLIYIWVQDELSFDRFHTNVDELYRVEFDGGSPNRNWGSPGELGPSIKEQIPEIDMVSRIMNTRTSLILQKDEKQFHEKNYTAVDPEFFSMFSFNFLEGSPKFALDDPYSLVISKSLATKYFGEAKALGKTIKLNNAHLMTIKGVIEDIPANSSIQFDFAFNFDFVKILGWYSDNWGSVWLQTFVKVNKDINKPTVAKKVLESIVRGKANRWDEKSTKALVLNSLSDMRLRAYSYTGSGFAQKNLESVYTFSALGILILFIACINFMNLSTARSAKRAKEIGMRKVLGAVRKNIRTQFIGEALLQTLFSVILALVLVVLLLTPFNEISDKTIHLGYLLKPKFLLGVFGITILVALIAGSYPAFYLSSFQPIKVLKGNLNTGLRSASLRKILVIIQFGLSIFLIIGTIVIHNQMDYVRNKSLGYDKNHVLYIPLIHNDTRIAFNKLKDNWLARPDVAQISASQVKPSLIGWSSSANWEGKDPEDYSDIFHNRIDLDYLKTLGIEIVEGRSFSSQFPSDNAENRKGSFIINETLAAKMSPEGKALGMSLNMAGNEGLVIGIMKDFHFSSLKSKIKPLALILRPSEKEYAIIKLSTKDVIGSILSISKSWNSILPNYPFEYHFLDEDFDKIYQADERLGKLLGTFSILAIIIASLGLFGLSSFTAEERRKEVAIRKVLGAHHLRVTYLLCKDFILLVLVANIIAWPLGKLVMGAWLNGFAYRIQFGYGIFATSAVIALLIAISTIVFHTSKVALSNPVNALKYE